MSAYSLRRQNIDIGVQMCYNIIATENANTPLYRVFSVYHPTTVSFR